MQWLIDSIKKLCNDYTDQAILDAKVIPPGTIIMWPGKWKDIPDGWSACDGLNGTPDFRSLFVRAAGSGFNPGDTGGSISHTHLGGTDISSGANLASTSNHIPPYYVLWYIMKL